MKQKYRGTAARLFLLVLAIWTFPIFSQSGDDQEESKKDEKKRVEEMVVTAQRREQNIQNVPIAVSAFQSADLEEIGVKTIDELQLRVPNITLVPSRATNNTLTAYIRGIGQADPLWGFEPGVGVYIDDVYIARPQGAMLEVYDIERIEILRGPQGTLYGRNTIGGAIKYVTKSYSTEREGIVKLSLGDYSQTDATIGGHTSLASGKVILGGAVAMLKRDGFGEYLPTGEDNYHKDIITGRASLEYRPNDRFYLKFLADVLQDDSNTKQGYRLTPEDPADPTSAQPLGDIYDTRAGIGHRQSVETSGQSLMMQWFANERFSFKSITAFRKGDTETPIDFDGLEQPYFDVPAFYRDEQTSQEFQALFNSDRVSGVAGVYFFDGDASGAFDVVLSEIAGGFTILQAGQVGTKSYAAFADVSWQLNDQWGLNIGGRFTRDDKDVTVLRENFLGLRSPTFGNNQAVSLGAVTDYANQRDFSEFTPRLGVNYTPNDRFMTYLSYNRGFKSGGFDMRGNAAEAPETMNGYDSEIVDTFEIGFKSTLSRGVLLNSAAFFSDYQDMQVTTQFGIDSDGDGVDDTFQSLLRNAGNSEISGAELELVAQPNSKFAMNLALGFIDAKFVSFPGFDANGNAIDLSNVKDIPHTPDWTGNFGMSYRMSTGDIGFLTTNFNISYRDAYQIFEDALPLLDPESATLINVGVLWSLMDGRLTLNLQGKNIGDEEYKVGGYNFPTLGPPGGATLSFYGDPATYSLSASYAF